MGVSLPRWVWAGAACLAFVAGMINVVGFLGFQHQAITHLTGNTSLLGIAVARGRAGHVALLAPAALTGGTGSAYLAFSRRNRSGQPPSWGARRGTMDA